MGSDAIVHVTDQSFAQEVLSTATLAVLDLWAPWCGPCRAIAPLLEELAVEFSGRVKVCKIDIDNNPETPVKYGVRGIPTLIFFKGGQEVDRLIGAAPKSRLVEIFNKHVS